MNLMFFQQSLQPISLHHIEQIAILVLYSSFSVLIWFLLALWFDRRDPEPARQLFRTFFLGSLMALLMFFINNYLVSELKSLEILKNALFFTLAISFIIDGVLEEGGKLFALFKVYRFKDFDQPLDGIIYGMILGLGFAFVENIFYGLSAQSMETAKNLLLLRGLTSTFMHFVSGGILGYSFGLAKFYQRKKLLLIFSGYISAFLFHGSYNLIARINFDWILLPLIIWLFISYEGVLKKISYLTRISPNLLAIMKRDCRLNPKD